MADYRDKSRKNRQVPPIDHFIVQTMLLADVTRPIQRTDLTQMKTYLLEDKSDSSVALAISQLLLKRVRVRLSPCRRSALRYVTEPRKKVLACSCMYARARVCTRACVSVSIIQQTRVAYLFYIRHCTLYVGETNAGPAY